MTLADKLKEARKNAGLTQVELADKLCVSRQAITKWESGKGIPDVDNLKMISKVLNVSIDFLLDDEEVIDKTIIKEQISLGITNSGNEYCLIKKNEYFYNFICDMS